MCSRVTYIYLVIIAKFLFITITVNLQITDLMLLYVRLALLGISRHSRRRERLWSPQLLSPCPPRESPAGRLRLVKSPLPRMLAL